MATSDTISAQITNTMDFARAEANSMISAANALVSASVDVLTEYTPNYPEEEITIEAVGLDFGGQSFSATEKPPEFPTIRTPQTVFMGELGDLDSVDATFDAVAPTLILPDFNYTDPLTLGTFSGTAPDIDTTITIPDSPSIIYPDLPTLLELNTDIELDELVLPSTSFTLPSYSNDTLTTFAAEFSTGTAAVPSLDNYGMQLVERFYPGLTDQFSKLYSRVNNILDGSDTALTEGFDLRLYESLNNRITLESTRAEQALNDASVASGWELPGAVQAAGLARIQQDLASNLNKAAMEVYSKRGERELQHLQFVMTLADRLQTAAVTMFGNAFSMQIKAFESALAYADSAVKFAGLVYQLKQHDYEMLLTLTDKQIAVYKALLEAELAKVEVTKAKLAVENLKTNLNHDLIAQYTAQLQGQETKVKLYQGQVAALEATLIARKLPLDAFKANVEGFQAAATAKKSEYDLLAARISGDKAKTEGQLARLEVYKTQATVFGIEADAKAKKIAAQSQRNQQILEEFKVRMGAEIDLTKLDVDIAEHALKAYTAMAQVYIAESEEKLNEAKFTFQKALEDAKLELEQKKLNYDREFKALELEMARIKAVAEISAAGANVQGGIGKAAIAVMNTMVHLQASVQE